MASLTPWGTLSPVTGPCWIRAEPRWPWGDVSWSPGVWCGGSWHKTCSEDWKVGRGRGRGRGRGGGEGEGGGEGGGGRGGGGYL